MNTTDFIIQYSPRPRSSYVASIGERSYGPAISTLLTTPDRWNLAYLSWDYDKVLQHPDPNFTVLVHKTCQMALKDVAQPCEGGVCPLKGTHGSVGSLFLRPAPQAVKLLTERVRFQALPLFRAYGKKWIRTLETRARVCLIGDEEANDCNLDLLQARQLLRRF